MATQVEQQQHQHRHEVYRHVQASWASRLSQTPSMDYEIQPLTDRDGPRMLDFLRRLFFRDEPLNVAVGLVGPDQATCVELEDYCLESIPEGLSLKAVDSKTGLLMGICINGNHEVGHEDEAVLEADECPNPKFRKILQLLAAVGQRASSIIADIPGDGGRRQLEVRILSVDGSWRGRGIATALLDKTRDLARQNKYELVRVDCTSYFSARAVARLGFQKIFSMPYDEYRRDGQVIFRPEAPHTEISTYVLSI